MNLREDNNEVFRLKRELKQLEIKKKSLEKEIRNY